MSEYPTIRTDDDHKKRIKRSTWAKLGVGFLVGIAVGNGMSWPPFEAILIFKGMVVGFMTGFIVMLCMD